MFKKIPEDKSYEYKGYKIERRYHGSFKRNLWLIDEVDLDGNEWMHDYVNYDEHSCDDFIMIDNNHDKKKKYFMLESLGGCKLFISQVLLNEDWS